MITTATLFLSILLAPTSEPALQAVIQTNFEFLSSVRTTKAEFWIISPDQVYEKRTNNQVRRIMPFTAPAPEKFDIHTLGFDYEPDFKVAKVEDTAETRTVQERTCKLTTAHAIAEYAEARLRLWFCPQADVREARLSAAIAHGMSARFPNLEREILKLLEARPNRTVLEAQAEIEPPIAPLMKFTVRTLSLDVKPVEGNLAIPAEGGRNAR